jgi:hypothetical protein
MAVYSYRKRAFLNPASIDMDSYIHAVVESSLNGDYKWTTNVLTIADCRRRIILEFVLGTKRHRRISLRKINLLIEILTAFRDALQREIAFIEKSK